MTDTSEAYDMVLLTPETSPSQPWSDLCISLRSMVMRCGAMQCEERFLPPASTITSIAAPLVFMRLLPAPCQVSIVYECTHQIVNIANTRRSVDPSHNSTQIPTRRVGGQSGRLTGGVQWRTEAMRAN